MRKPAEGVHVTDLMFNFPPGHPARARPARGDIIETGGKEALAGAYTWLGIQ